MKVVIFCGGSYFVLRQDIFDYLHNGEDLVMGRPGRP